ncbi:MAG: hypothetical protein QW572_07760 [Candidatus Nitrosocaldus sp.]
MSETDIISSIAPQLTQLGLGAVILTTVIKWMNSVERNLNDMLRILDEIKDYSNDLNHEIDYLADSINRLIDKRYNDKL